MKEASVLPPNGGAGGQFPGETAEGTELLAGVVRKALNFHFQNRTAPNIPFVDRAPGLSAANSGKTTQGFKAGLHANSLKTYYKDDGSHQPGNLQEAMLHETVVS